MSEQTEMISVVIPVYKVEQTLDRCVQSVAAQTYRNLEIILVDDGSPDGCPEKCDAWARRDERVRVVHKPNGGLASARNAGMDIMRGDWLFFLDSDDWIDPDGLALLMDTAKKYDVDFVRYRAFRTGWPGLPENAPAMLEAPREIPGGYYDRERIVRDVYPRLLVTPQLTMGAIVGAYMSLYNIDFMRRCDLRFYDDIRYSEDLIFSARVVRAAKAFYYISDACVYHYWYNPASISKSFRADRWEACKKIIEHGEADFSSDPAYDFSDALLYLRWFCILLALNERRFLPDAKSRRAYCAGIMKDPVVRRTPLPAKKFDVPQKQLALMALVRGGAAGAVAMI